MLDAHINIHLFAGTYNTVLPHTTVALTLSALWSPTHVSSLALHMNSYYSTKQLKLQKVVSQLGRKSVLVNQIVSYSHPTETNQLACNQL